MYVRKPIEVSFTLSPNECFLYPQDHKDLVRELFSKQYKDRCVSRCYVLEILDVLRVSPVMMIESDLQGRGRINAILAIEGIIYDYGSIIPGCKLISQNSGTLSLESKYTTVNVPVFNNSLQLNLPINSIIPIEVESINYDTIYDKAYTKVVSCIGSIYNPMMRIKQQIFRVGMLTKLDVKYLTEINDYYKDKIVEMESNDKMMSKLYDNFYGYKKQPKNLFMDRYKECKVIKKLPLFDFKSFPTYEDTKSVDKEGMKYVSKPDSMPQEEANYVQVDVSKLGEEAIIYDIDAKGFIEYCMMNYYDYVMSVMELSLCYDKEEYKKLEPLWKLYNSNKK